MQSKAPRKRLVPAGLVFLLLLMAGAGASRADVAFEFDRQTLNDVLAEVTLDEVVVPVAAGRSLTAKLEELVVTGFDPGAGENGQGYILTSLRLRVPEIGLNVPVKPRISLNVVEHETGTLLELRFEEVNFSLPFAGTINVAPLLPPLTYPTDGSWFLAGARGDVPIESRIKEVKMGRESIRLVFQVEVKPPLGE